MAISKLLKKMILGRSFNAEDGTITIMGKSKLIMYEARAFSYTVQEIYNIMGERGTYELFHKAGKVAVSEVRSAFGKAPVDRFLSGFLAPLTEMYGWGKMELNVVKNDKRSFLGEARVRESPMVEYSKEDFGKNSKIFLFYKGLLSGGSTAISSLRCDVDEKRTKIDLENGEFFITIIGEKNGNE